MEITVKKLSKSSVFKIIVLGNTFGLFALCIVFGIAALFGAETVSWNEEYKTGVEGLLYSFVIGPVFGFFLGCFMWIFSVFGLWVYSFWRPLTLEVEEYHPPSERG